MKRILFGLAMALMATGAPAAPARMPWSDLVVFGDSLSDNGNYGAGIVATNGNTWAGQLGALPWIAGGTNFAYGGAKAVTDADFAPDFTAQRALFAGAMPALGHDPVAVVWFGGNDLLNAADPTAIPNAIAAIGAGIGELATNFGFTRFLVPGLPDLSLIPRFNAAPDTLRLTAQAASAAFNTALKALVATSVAGGLDARFLDIDAIFDALLDDPATFGFTDTKGHCARGAIDCAGYVFWDDIHPTEATHAIIAAAVRDALMPAPVPLPAGGFLLVAGLGALVALRRRRPAAGPAAPPAA
jgi:phospholipase/lecithinase/hemolysin